MVRMGNHSGAARATNCAVDRGHYAVVGCSPSTLRNWIKTFAPYLSPGASPQAGAERILTPADVATLQHIKTQRDALKDYDMIAAELATMPPGSAIEPYIDVQATTTPQEAPQTPIVATVPTELLAALQRLADDRHGALVARIESMESRQAISVQAFAMGIVVGIILVLAAAGLIWLGMIAR